MMWRRRTEQITAAVVAVVAALTLTVGVGVAGADPTPAPATSDPAAPATSDPAAPPAGEDDTGGQDKIKSGTAKKGTIQWEEFGGKTEDAPETLDEFSKMIIGYALTVFGGMVVISGLVVFILMGLGFKGRSALAKTALESSVHIVLAVVIVGSIGAIAGAMFLGAGLT